MRILSYWKPEEGRVWDQNIHFNHKDYNVQTKSEGQIFTERINASSEWIHTEMGVHQMGAAWITIDWQYNNKKYKC